MSEKYRHGIPERYEQKEAAEVFRASLGFDFVFTRDDHDQLHCYCIEINGHDSGIKGIQDIPEQDLNPTVRQIADIRATDNEETLRRDTIAREIGRNIETGLFPVSERARQQIFEYVKKSLRKEPMFSYAYDNPKFIEELTNDKRLQPHYIPERFRPREWRFGTDTKSSTGGWIIKPATGRAGVGISVVTDNELKIIYEHYGEKLREFVVQEYIPSAGAEMDPDSKGRRAASMRLLVDFRYLEDGRIIPDYSIAYQRVSPHDVDPEVMNAKGLEAKDILVVNRKRGATSAAASPEEERLAKEAANAIIKNIAREYVFATQGGNEGGQEKDPA